MEGRRIDVLWRYEAHRGAESDVDTAMEGEKTPDGSQRVSFWDVREANGDDRFARAVRDADDTSSRAAPRLPVIPLWEDADHAPGIETLRRCLDAPRWVLRIDGDDTSCASVFFRCSDENETAPDPPVECGGQVEWVEPAYVVRSKDEWFLIR